MIDRHPFLTVVSAEAAVLVLGIAVWNLWTYRVPIKRWLVDWT